MNKIVELKTKVKNLYDSSPAEVRKWSSWIYNEHVVKVVEIAENLSKEYGANEELAVAGALLHDVADAKMRREEPNHAEISNEIANALLKKVGYSDKDIEFIINEVIKPHGCKKIQPTALEGKVLATADAIAHLTTNLYTELYELFPDGETQQEYNKWVYEKLVRDFFKKIQFDEKRPLYKTEYDRLREKFKQ